LTSTLTDSAVAVTDIFWSFENAPTSGRPDIPDARYRRPD